MSEKTIQHIIEILDRQDERLSKLEGIVTNQQDQLTILPDYREAVGKLDPRLIELNNTMQQLKYPEKDMRETKALLRENTEVLKHPPKVNYHIPKLIGITAALFLALALACSGWYMTGSKLDRYQAADTKYRYLKLEDSTAIQEMLSKADSLYRKNPSGMLEDVEQREEAIQRLFELNRKAEQMEKEEKELKAKAKKR